MTDLTEKWKAGELPHGAFYVKIYGVVLIDFFDATKLKFVRFEESAIEEVLAPVPRYNKLQALKEENARLKELLKECKELIKRSFDDYPDSAIYRAINLAIGEREE